MKWDWKLRVTLSSGKVQERELREWLKPMAILFVVSTLSLVPLVGFLNALLITIAIMLGTNLLLGLGIGALILLDWWRDNR